MSHAVALRADGEVGEAARRAVEAAGAELEWDEGGSVVLGRAAGAGLQVGVDRCRALEGARTRFPETDLVVVRELEEGAGAEARRHAEGLGRETITVIGEDEPAEGLCARVVADPSAYDVLVLPAALGAVVSDLAAGMAGGLGLAPRLAFGEDAAIFGAAPHAENPAGLMLAGALLLHHLGEAPAAGRLEEAVAAVVREGTAVTADLKPTPNDPSAVGAAQFADAVIEEMERR